MQDTPTGLFFITRDRQTGQQYDTYPHRLTEASSLSSNYATQLSTMDPADSAQCWVAISNHEYTL